MRHADQIGMQADRHDAAGLRALGVERIELAFDRSDKLIDRAVARVEKRRIVDLVGIGDRDEPLAAADIHEERLIVADPIRDILHPFLGQVVERVPCFGEARAEPAPRLLAGQCRDLGQRAGNRLPLLLRLHLIEPQGIGLVVAEDLPAQFDRGFDDLRVVIADVAVQGRAGADPVFLQHIHDPPDADAVAVIALRPGAHRGNRRLARIGASRDAAGQREEFDVGDDPDREAGAVGPIELWPVVDRGIGERAVIARFHRGPPRVRIKPDPGRQL